MLLPKQPVSGFLCQLKTTILILMFNVSTVTCYDFKVLKGFDINSAVYRCSFLKNI